MKKIVLTMLIMIICPLKIYADSISINCPSTVSENQEFTCEITGQTDTSISGVETTIDVSGGVTFVSFVSEKTWSGYATEGNVSIYTAEEITGTFKIGTAKFKKIGKDSGTVELNDVAYYTAEDHTVISSTSCIVNIKEDNTPSIENEDQTTESPPEVITENTNDDVYLEDLIIDNYDLLFSKDVYEYELSIGDETELVINPILSNSLSTYKIVGNKDLKNGSVIKIIVSKDDFEVTYTINIIKENEAKVQSILDYKKILITIIVFLVIFNILRIIIKRK